MYKKSPSVGFQGTKFEVFLEHIAYLHSKLSRISYLSLSGFSSEIAVMITSLQRGRRLYFLMVK